MLGGFEQTGDVRYSYLILAIHAAQRELTGLNIQATENTGWTLATLARDMTERGALVEQQAQEKQVEELLPALQFTVEAAWDGGIQDAKDGHDPDPDLAA
jgi:hypothetical protein